MRGLTFVMTSLALLAGAWLNASCSKSEHSGAAAKASVSAAPPPPSAVPLPSFERDFLGSGIRSNLCEPASCGPIACEKFSDGETNQGPARIARCRWTDLRDKANTARCAYILYSLDAKGQVSNVLPGKPASSDTCASDPAFTDSVKNLAKYTGAVP